MSGLDTYLTQWRPQPLGHTETLSAAPAHALAAVLETPADLVPREVLPPLWHWIYFLSWPAQSDLGSDGHPSDGPFLPPIPDRRRMFAGGRLAVTRPLQFEVPTKRTSSVVDVAVKHGRSGEMVFVTVRSEFVQEDQLCLVEEQDHVYRCGEGTTKTLRSQRPTRLPHSDAPWRQRFTADPVRLFRFSALTANAHRIHYDSPYAREVERYPDLVVHGPMLALLMVDLARFRSGSTVATVDYRFRSPVFANDPVLVVGTPRGTTADMTVLTEPGTVMAQAEVGFS